MLRARASVCGGAPGQVAAAGAGKKKGADVRVIHAQNILRPQLRFEDKPDNSRRPWVPILTEKHFAQVPFQPGTVPRRTCAARCGHPG